MGLIFEWLVCKLFHNKRHYRRDHSDLRLYSGCAGGVIGRSRWLCQYSCGVCGRIWVVKDEMLHDPSRTFSNMQWPEHIPNPKYPMYEAGFGGSGEVETFFIKRLDKERTE